MEEQAATYLPSIELGHDCVFCIDDLERIDVCDKIRVARGGGAEVSEKDWSLRRCGPVH